MNKPALSLPEFVVLFALLTSLTALSIDAMLPALPQIAHSLAVADYRNTQLIVSLFILGMVFGELIFGPLSDAIGRKKALLMGIAVYCIGTLCAMMAPSLEWLLLGRIIQGIGVSGPKIASRALIRDQYQGNAMARILSLIMMILIVVPMLAPAYGQLILTFADWRFLFLTFLVLALAVTVWFAVRQPETLAVHRRIPLSFLGLARSTGRILRHPKVMACAVTAGLTFGGLLTYLSTSQSIFQDIYHTGPRFALYFALLALGVGIASLVNSHLVMRLGMFRLVTAALTGMAVFAGLLLILGLANDGVAPFGGFMGLCFCIFFCMGMVFGNINAMAMEFLGHVAGLGASLVGSLSGMVAVLVSFIVGRFYDRTTTPLALGFVLCALLGLALVILTRRSGSAPVEPPVMIQKR